MDWLAFDSRPLAWLVRLVLQGPEQEHQKHYLQMDPLVLDSERLAWFALLKPLGLEQENRIHRWHMDWLAFDSRPLAWFVLLVQGLPNQIPTNHSSTHNWVAR